MHTATGKIKCNRNMAIKLVIISYNLVTSINYAINRYLKKIPVGQYYCKFILAAYLFAGFSIKAPPDDVNGLSGNFINNG